MYLTKRTYVGANYEHNNITGEISLSKSGKQIPIKLKRVTSVIEQIGYWRKANAIHQWFVNNVQKGVDDCKEYHLDSDILKALLKDCKKVIKTPDKADKVLPTKSGFFFGSTNYGEYYLKDIEYTISMVEEALKEEDSEFCDYYYESSW